MVTIINISCLVHCWHFQDEALSRSKSQGLCVCEGEFLLPHAFEVHGAHHSYLVKW